ncbi:MAG: aminomethyl-transferring glycine dehydrogenase subunit GcvPA [Planctomycetota bacterium]|nr:aminomethyl-transferring glycine dehydrogenase subunit GcvPA [Planctomycetota bacterium]
MSYLFNTPDEQREMLETIGVDSIESLFDQIPDSLQLKRPLDIPPALSELELEQLVRELASRNVGPSDRSCFLGGGVYDHFIPSAVDAIAGRSEYYTAYTPYQAEASQGSLQTFFEYQSLICQLTGMDVSNASLYEGGTAVSEAVFMAMRCTKRHRRIVLLGSVHPEYRQIVQTYLGRMDCELVIVPTPGGTAAPSAVEEAINDQTACVVTQHPNFYGCLEEVEQISALAHKHGALSIVSFDPIGLGILKRPGDQGADIAVAEGQSLGTPMQYGGPFLGILACRQEFVRQMPGRLIGQTTDRNGKRCFVLNLQAREQHIRREKATSNICTNQGLIAIRATVFLSLLGPAGMRQVAELSCSKAHYAAQRLTAQDGIELAFDQPFFKEFTLQCRDGADAVIQRAQAAGFDIGPALRRVSHDESEDRLLVAVTECRTREEIDALADAIAGSSAVPCNSAKPVAESNLSEELEASCSSTVAAPHEPALRSARSSSRKTT